MPRPDKVAAVEDVTERLNGANATLLTDYRGLTVAELADLRAELRKAGARYQVVKNTLTRRAATEAGIEGLHPMLVGPTALVFCEDDPVGPSKALREFAKTHPDLLIKGGYLDGQVLDAEATTKLADLESREELLAKLAGLMYGALANFARLLKAPLEQQARLMQALHDDGGAPGAPAGAPEADATEEAAEPEADATEEAAEPEADATEEAAAPEADAAEADEAADDEPAS